MHSLILAYNFDQVYRKKSLTATLSNNHTIKRYFIVEFNETNVILHMLVYFSINLVKFFEI